MNVGATLFIADPVVAVCTRTPAAIDRRTPSDLIEAKGLKIAEALKALRALAS